MQKGDVSGFSIWGQDKNGGWCLHWQGTTTYGVALKQLEEYKRKYKSNYKKIRLDDNATGKTLKTV